MDGDMMDTEVLVAIVGGGFTLINAVFAAVVGAINKKTQKIVTDARQNEEIAALKTDVTAMKEGMLSILRDSIITMHDRQMDAGTLPLYMRDALEHSYNAYHALGGNGTVAALYKELLELPIE